MQWGNGDDSEALDLGFPAPVAADRLNGISLALTILNNGKKRTRP
jgi:hypothetical protein